MVLNNIGHLEMTLGHYEKQKHIKKNANLVQLSFHLVSANLGDLYLKQKCYDEAMKHLKQSLVDMPTMARSHKLIRQIHREQEREEEAQKEFLLYEQLKEEDAKKK